MKVIKMTRHTPEFFELLKDDPKKMHEPLRRHLEMLKKMKEDGKLVDAYFLPGDGRAVFVFDFENESEMDQSLLFDPMGFTFDLEMHPAVPLFAHIENALKTME